MALALRVLLTTYTIRLLAVLVLLGHSNMVLSLTDLPVLPTPVQSTPLQPHQLLTLAYAIPILESRHSKNLAYNIHHLLGYDSAHDAAV